MTNPLQTIPNLPVAVGVTGTDELWINQSGTDRRTNLSTLQSSVAGPIGPQGNPGGNASAIGVATAVSGLSLNTGTASTYNLFHTDGYYTAGDGGGAFYYRNTGSAQPGDLMSADGVRLSLSLAQQLTWEMLGAPTTGAICTAAFSHTAMTTSGLQSGVIAIGQTVTAAGATGAIPANVKILSGSGTNWVLNTDVGTIGSTVVCMNDSQPYVAAALALGPQSLLSVGPHWFSQTIIGQTAGGPIHWFGPQGYLGGSAGYPATWHFPAGYGGIALSPTNNIITPQGDITFTGSEPFGGIFTSSIDKINFQIGTGSRPAASINHRPAVGIYAISKWTNIAVTGADGNGYTVFGNIPVAIADKGVLRDFYVQNSYDNGGEVSGGDGNTWDIQNCILNQNGSSGWYEHSFLQTDYRTIQSQGNGKINAFVRRSNNLYYSIQDSNLNQDPLTQTAYWTLWQSSVGADTWDPAVTYRVGAAFRTAGSNNRVTFVGLYCESGQPPVLLQNANANGPLSVVLGGLNAAGLAGSFMGMIDGVSTAASYLATGDAQTVVPYASNGDAFPIAFNFAANNIAGSNAVGSYTFQYVGVQKSLVKGGPSGASGGYVMLTGKNGSGTLTDVLGIDGPLRVAYPAADNAVALGTLSLRFSDIKTVLINGQLGGVSADNGDAGVTLTVGTKNQTQLWNTVITADRAVALSTTGALNGSKFRVLRGAGATGAFNLNVGTGPLKALTAAGTWVDVEYNGSAWIETASGSL